MLQPNRMQGTHAMVQHRAGLADGRVQVTRLEPLPTPLCAPPQRRVVRQQQSNDKPTLGRWVGIPVCAHNVTVMKAHTLNRMDQAKPIYDNPETHTLRRHMASESVIQSAWQLPQAPLIGELSRCMGTLLFLLGKSEPLHVCDRKGRRSRPEALLIFTGNDECLNHFGIYKVAAKLVQLAEPEIIAGVV